MSNTEDQSNEMLYKTEHDLFSLALKVAAEGESLQRTHQEILEIEDEDIRAVVIESKGNIAAQADEVWQVLGKIAASGMYEKLPLMITGVEQQISELGFEAVLSLSDKTRLEAIENDYNRAVRLAPNAEPKLRALADSKIEAYLAAINEASQQRRGELEARLHELTGLLEVASQPWPVNTIARSVFENKTESSDQEPQEQPVSDSQDDQEVALSQPADSPEKKRQVLRGAVDVVLQTLTRFLQEGRQDFSFLEIAHVVYPDSSEQTEHKLMSRIGMLLQSDANQAKLEQHLLSLGVRLVVSSKNKNRKFYSFERFVSDEPVDVYVDESANTGVSEEPPVELVVEAAGSSNTEKSALEAKTSTIETEQPTAVAAEELTRPAAPVVRQETLKALQMVDSMWYDAYRLDDDKESYFSLLGWCDIAHAFKNRESVWATQDGYTQLIPTDGLVDLAEEYLAKMPSGLKDVNLRRRLALLNLRIKLTELEFDGQKIGKWLTEEFDIAASRSREAVSMLHAAMLRLSEIRSKEHFDAVIKNLLNAKPELVVTVSDGKHKDVIYATSHTFGYDPKKAIGAVGLGGYQQDGEDTMQGLHTLVPFRPAQTPAPELAQGTDEEIPLSDVIEDDAVEVPMVLADEDTQDTLEETSASRTEELRAMFRESVADTIRVFAAECPALLQEDNMSISHPAIKSFQYKGKYTYGTRQARQRLQESKLLPKNAESLTRAQRIIMYIYNSFQGEFRQKSNRSILVQVINEELAKYDAQKAEQGQGK